MKYIFFFFFYLLSLLPLSVLYVFGDILFLLSYYIIRYRRKVVDENLRNAFSELDNKEIDKLSKSFFRHFFNIMMEMIKMISVKKKFFDKRVRYSNIELLDNFAKKNQSILVVLGHFNNWEWLFVGASSLIKQDVLGIYKDINTSFFDYLMLKTRKKFGADLVSMQDSYREIFKRKDSNLVIGLIADQSPTLSNANFYTHFFNQEVPVFLGPEKLAKKMNAPLIYCDMKKIKRGYYEVNFEILESNPQDAKEGDITKRFINRLERQIKDRPDCWLWSHRRWKHKR